MSKGHGHQSYCPCQAQPAFTQGLESQVPLSRWTSPNCLGVQISNRFVCSIVKVEERLHPFFLRLPGVERELGKLKAKG